MQGYLMCYVILLVHDNASALRGLKCLILWLIYRSCKKSQCTKFSFGGGGSIASRRSIYLGHIKLIPWSSDLRLV